jgi:prepilin-type N-terminal cleavage/methylation domain-containing protein
MVKSGNFSILERSVRDERMKRSRKLFFARNRSAQAGMTLIETMIALAILLVVAAGVMGLAGVAVSTTETQGHLAARTAEYAQDKMEQLLALKFCDGQTDTTVFPAVVNANGTGLAGCTNPTAQTPTATAGGGLSTTAPTTGYVDYLDASGNLVASTASWEYVRVWQITVPAGSVGLKQITVLAKANHAVGGSAVVPQATVAALKTFPF